MTAAPGPNGRALVALAVIVFGLMLYAALAVTIADYLPDHLFVQTVYIAVAGLAWVWPAIRLTAWAQRR